MNGSHMKCQRCDGKGQVTNWSFGVREPDECSDCGGSGSVWRYNSGALASYYGGPFLSGPDALRLKTIDLPRDTGAGLRRG